MFDQGQGPPLVVIPGLHGRWEWSKPLLRLMATRCRTVSYSLCGDIGSRRRLDRALGFENYVRQLDEVMDAAGIEQAALCGISYGGFVALRYAVERPARVNALVLASTPGPGFRPTEQQARWLSKPWLSAPAFALTSPARVWPEVRTAIPSGRLRMRFFVRQGARCVAAPIVPSLMASRMRAASVMDFQRDCSGVTVRTLVITGEEGLDRVVPVASTRAYTSLIRGAQYTMMPGTGHMGCLTQPDRFAQIVTDFVHADHQ